jgi:hypothetical protein
MKLSGLATLVGFNVVWFVCAIGAARGFSSPGVAAAATFLALTLWSRRWNREDIILVLFSGLIGAIAETLFGYFGLIRYAAPLAGSMVAPAWIVALWLAFGATISTTVTLLGARAGRKAAGLGLIFGPAAYAAGGAMGALSVSPPTMRSYVVISMVWALAFPALVKAIEALRAKRDNVE